MATYALNTRLVAKEDFIMTVDKARGGGSIFVPEATEIYICNRAINQLNRGVIEFAFVGRSNIRYQFSPQQMEKFFVLENKNDT